MKNRQGIVWAPVLIMFAAVVVAGVAAYYMFQASKPDNNNGNVTVVNQANNNTTINPNINVATNTNQVINSNVSTNTNSTANTNTVSNTNTTTDPTAGWKTYTSQEFGYSIRYPQDWTIDTERTSATEVVFDTGVATETRYAVKATKTNQTLDQWKGSLTFETIIQTSNTAIAGQPALKVEFQGLAGTYYGVRNGDYLFQLTDSGGYLTSSGMLSTFTFTD